MSEPIRFFSDNAATVCEPVMAALHKANRLDTAYDGDRYSAQLDGAFSDLFGREVTALWVTSGTAANCLALAALCPPHGSILCHEQAHIEMDEAGAPGFFTHGAKLTLLEGEGAKVMPDAIHAACEAVRPDIHQVQPHAVSITNATEYGLSYSADEVAAVGDACKARGLKLHMDGARFANAVAFSGAELADLTWRAGVDTMAFGFVKNGGMNAEMLIAFDPELAQKGAIARMRKRSGHLQSKGRFAAAQILAMLNNDVWRSNGEAANKAARALAEACGPERLVHPVEANELFVRMTPDEAASIRGQGFDFYDWAPGEVRLVTSWDQDMDAVAKLAAAIRAL